MVPSSVLDVSSDPKASPSAMPPTEAKRQGREGGKNKQTSGPPSQARGRPHCPASQTADRRNLNLGGCESPALIHPRTNPQRLSQLRNNGYRSIPSTKQLTIARATTWRAPTDNTARAALGNCCSCTLTTRCCSPPLPTASDHDQRHYVTIRQDVCSRTPQPKPAFITRPGRPTLQPASLPRRCSQPPCSSAAAAHALASPPLAPLHCIGQRHH